VAVVEPSKIPALVDDSEWIYWTGSAITAVIAAIAAYKRRKKGKKNG
jgi:hypothetical protein